MCFHGILLGTTVMTVSHLKGFSLFFHELNEDVFSYTLMEAAVVTCHICKIYFAHEQIQDASS